jgi:hypothetical protein
MDDRLELLIGKLLDGELSPKERRLLDNELEQDGHAKELLEQMRTLHECSCGVVTHEVLGRGADPEELFERAWQQNKRSLWRRVVRVPKRDGSRLGSRIADGHVRWGSQTRGFAFGQSRFAVGVAAGFLLGLVLHFVAVQYWRTPTNISSGPPVARNVPPGRYEQMGIRPVVQPEDPRQPTREVDWYVFTDRAGNQWLIEGVQEGLVKSAAYRGSL